MQVGAHALFAAKPERAAVIIGVRQKLHACAEQRAERLFRPQAAHQAQRALAHAVITALKRQHRAASSGSAYQFQRGFHRIGAGRATELDLRVVGQLLRQQAEQVLNELVFDWRGQIQGVQRQLITDHLLNRFDDHWMVMPQRQRARACQAIDEAPPFDVLDVNALGSLERQRDTPRVTARIGFLAILPGQQWRLFELVERFSRCRGNPCQLIIDKPGSN